MIAERNGRAFSTDPITDLSERAPLDLKATLQCARAHLEGRSDAGGCDIRTVHEKAAYNAVDPVSNGRSHHRVRSGA